MGDLEHPDDPTQPTDGRRERVRLGKAKVVKASIDLIVEGHRNFTVQHIAERAGLSEKTVVRYFETYNELIDEGVSQMYGRVAHLFTTAVPDGSIPERVRTLVALRLELIRKYDPLIASMKRGSVNFPAAARAIDLRDRLMSDQFDAWFTPASAGTDATSFILFRLLFSYDALLALDEKLGEDTEDTVVGLALALLGQPTP